MEYFLEVTTEVNGEKVVAYRKTWLEYPEEENHKCLFQKAIELVSKLTGISKFKLEEARNFFWNYEEFKQEVHGKFNCVDCDEVYDTVFYNDNPKSTA